MSRINLKKSLPALFALALAPVAHAADAGYAQTILVANKPEFNPTAMVDPHLLNPWGIALRPPGIGGHIWISNAADGSTTTYIGDVNGIPLYQDGLKVVPIEAVPEDPPGYMELTGRRYVMTVTGQVYNAASDVPGQPIEFPVSGPALNYATDPAAPVGTISGAAKFIFVTAEGTINAWRSGTNPGMEKAVIVKDFTPNSPTQLGLEYTPGFMGVALTTDAFTTDGLGNKVADNRLYVADFPNNRVQIFNNQWQDITGSTAFERPADLLGDFRPFNIQYMNGFLYVAWAETAFEIDDPTEEIDVAGAGRIVAYDRDGHIVRDFSDQSLLSAPWGMAIAPSDFGTYSNQLLVANFGDGTIAAYDPSSGAALGYLRDINGDVIAIDGLWGLTFGNGVSLGDSNALYFTAGPNGEQDGLFGSIRVAPLAAVPEPASLGIAGGGAILLLMRRRRRA